MTPSTDLGPPPARLLLGEGAWARELVRLPLRRTALRRLPRGTGRPAVLVPGLGGPQSSMAPLRRFLRASGHDVRRSGRGASGPDVERQVERMLGHVERLAHERDDAVALVGWSIGGVICREVARERADLVRRVVTFGTPAVGGPSHTAVGRFYGRARVEAIVAAAEERASTPIEVPLTAVRSRRDGIVSEAACIDEATPGAENLLVSSTHIGMGLDPDVWRIVAERLARPDP